ncbi:MAG TPA: Ig-like domain-containing protein [Polyangia bacterium]|nr:Ig-like domain-containing protein [Polyangia bacterium]
MQVALDTVPPTVAVVAPAAGAVLTSATTVRAKASDNQSIAQVSLLIDGQALGTDTTSPYSFTLRTDTLWPGHHRLSASALDLAGNRADSAPVDVIVELPRTALFDDFTDGDMKGWAVQTGKWTVQRATDTPPSALLSSSTTSANVIATTQVKLTDSIVDTAVTLVGWSSKATLWVATRYQDRNNYDYLALKGAGHLQLGRRLKGVSTSLVSVPLALAQGDAPHLELRAEGCVLEARVNGVPVATAHTNGFVFPKGGVMLSIQAGAAVFDDVAIAPAP